MDIFSLLMFRLDDYLLRIKKLYSYIFRFFLPDIPDYGDDDNGYDADKHNNKVTI